MLAPRYRLRQRAHFALALSGGSSRKPLVRHRFFVCLGIPMASVLQAEQGQTESSLPKLGIVISRKVHKSAVVRNRLRRQIREWFRTEGYPAMEASGTPPEKLFGWVIVVRQQAVGQSYADLARSLHQSFRPWMEKSAVDASSGCTE